MREGLNLGELRQSERTVWNRKTGPGGTCGAIVSAMVVLLGLSSFARVGGQEAPAESVRTLTIPQLREAGYTVDYWTAEDGYPLSSVRAVAQTLDGYLWCGTSEGLVRFDGVRFTEFSSDEVEALGGERVMDLFCDSKGRLWIGCTGEVLVRYEEGGFHRIGEEEGLPEKVSALLKTSQVWRFSEGPEGDIWAYRVGRHFEFYRWRDGKFETVDYGDQVDGTFAVDDFLTDQAGISWFSSLSGQRVLERTPEGFQSRYPTQLDGIRESLVGRFLRLRDGTLGLTGANGCYAWTESGWSGRRSFPVPLPTPRISDSLELENGHLWISAAKQIFLSRGDHLLEVVGLPELNDLSFVPATIRDRSGIIWAAAGDVLFRIRPNIFRSWGESEGITSRRTMSVVEDGRGRIWITSAEGIYYLEEDDSTLVGHPPVRGSFWLATASRAGGVYVSRVPGPFQMDHWELERRTEEGAKQIASLKGDLNSLVESSDGILWLGADRGLFRWTEEDGLVKVPLPEVPDNVDVRDIEEDGNGGLLIAVRKHGLFRHADGTWERLTPPGAEGSGLIDVVHVDDDGNVWLGDRAEGLSVWRNGEWVRFGNIPGFPERVWSIVSDRVDGLWLGSDRGLMRFERSVLLRKAEGEDPEIRGVRFDRSDGLPSTKIRGWHTGLCRGSDGRIWVSTAQGVAVIDPVQWLEKVKVTEETRVYVEEMLIDDAKVPVRVGAETPPVQVGPGEHRFEFHYTAIDLGGSGKARFRHRLAGYDDDWVEVGDRRVAVYRKLPPGDYRFEVAATGSSGEWNPAGAFIRFTVAPFWWQRTSVRLVAAAAVLWGLFLLVRWRQRRIEARHAQQEEFSRQLIALQEDERKRIAAELHDGLGQNLLLLRNGIHGDESMQEEQLSRGMIEQIVSQSVQEVRTISRNLHPYQLEKLGLRKTILSTVRQVVQASGLELTADVDEVDGLLPTQTEINLYRIVQEALSNIIKHSHASNARVVVRKKPRSVVLEVEDDGCGFELDEMRSSDRGSKRGFGLQGMKERARIVGGRATYDSAPREGTRMRFEFPLASREAEVSG